jgi:hypothetical protein
MKTPEDEAFEDLERRQANGWRKRQVSRMRSANEIYDELKAQDRTLHWPSFLAGWKASTKRDRIK